MKKLFISYVLYEYLCVCRMLPLSLEVSQGQLDYSELESLSPPSLDSSQHNSLGQIYGTTDRDRYSLILYLFRRLSSEDLQAHCKDFCCWSRHYPFNSLTHLSIIVLRLLLELTVNFDSLVPVLCCSGIHVSVCTY